MIHSFYEFLANIPLLAIFALLLVTSITCLGGSGGSPSSDGTSDHETNRRYSKLGGVSDSDRIVRRPKRKRTVEDYFFSFCRVVWAIVSFLAVISGALQFFIYLNWLPHTL